MTLNRKSFSLLEIIIVIVLVALLTAVALPNYSRAVLKSHERAAIGNMLTIRTGYEVYITNSRGASPPNWASLSAINAGLGLALTDTVMTYNCSGGNCDATHPNGWVIRFTYPALSDLLCPAADCPTCPAAPPGCG